MQRISMHSVTVNCWINHHKLNFQPWCYLYHTKIHHTPPPCTKTLVAKAFSETYYNEKIRKNSHFLYYITHQQLLKCRHYTWLHRSEQVFQGPETQWQQGAYDLPSVMGDVPISEPEGPEHLWTRTSYFSLMIALTALAREGSCREKERRALAWQCLRTNTGVSFQNKCDKKCTVW